MYGLRCNNITLTAVLERDGNIFIRFRWIYTTADQPAVSKIIDYIYNII